MHTHTETTIKAICTGFDAKDAALAASAIRANAPSATKALLQRLVEKHAPDSLNNETVLTELAELFENGSLELPTKLKNTEWEPPIDPNWIDTPGVGGEILGRSIDRANSK